MIDQEELEVRQMFLEEAQEYVDTMDDGLVGIDPQSSTFRQQMDMVLRAAHSLKGAAGIMQYQELSGTAHRLEDSLKVIRTNHPEIDITAERLLLNGVGLIREIILINRQGQNIDKIWLGNQNQKIFEPLETYLSNAESLTVEDVPEVEIDIAALMFEQEIDGMLNDLEAKLDSSNLAEELQNLASQLNDFGEMLELPNFVQLNNKISQRIQTSNPDQICELAVSALLTWRRSQALVISGNKADIPSELDEPNFDDGNISDLVSLDYEEFNLTEDSELDIETINFEEDPTEIGDLGLDILLSLNLETTEQYRFSDREEQFDDVLLDASLNIEDYEESLYQEAELELSNPSSGNEPNSQDSQDALELDDLFDFGTDQEAIALQIPKLTPELTIESSISVKSLPPNSKSIDNPFSQFDEIENVLDSFNPFEDSWDELEEDIQDIFSSDSSDELLVEISLTDELFDEINAFADLTPLASPLAIFRDAEISSIVLDNIYDDFENDSEELIPKQVTQDTVSDLFDDLFRSSEYHPNLEATTEISNNILKNDSPREFEQLQSQQTPQDTISELFYDFFNSPISTSPLATEDISTSKTLNKTTVNDLFDSFLEDSDFLQETPQTFFYEPDSKDNRIENFPKDLFSDFSSEALGKNLSRYIKESTESKVEISLPDTLEDLKEDLEFSGDVPESIPTVVSDLVTAYVKDTSIRLPISRLEQLHDLSGEMIVGHNSLDLQIRQLRQLLKSLNDRIHTLEDANSHLSIVYDRMTTESITKSSKTKTEVISFAEFDSLELDSYSDLYSLSQSVSEAIVQLQEVVEDVDLSLNETEQNATSLTHNFRQLQTAIKETKMRPLMDIVGRFRRAIRALNLQHNKDVELILNGADLLIEQGILDVINDPLNHLLRNAFDHGIEDKNIRLLQGKNPQGRIEITATQKDGKILVTIADDGGGIDPEKIKTKAERSPSLFRLTSDQVASMNTEQLIELIFEPGFTTNDKVTSLSGRGVGMDVVRTNLKQIDAKIHTQTQLGVGTTFTIAIPFTLSTLRIVIAEINQMLLGIPTESIQTVIPDPSSGFKEFAEFYEWQDQTIRIFPLHNQLHRPQSDRHLEDKPPSATKSILVIKQDQNIWGIYVNGCWGEQEVTLRQPVGKIPLPKIYRGCAIAANRQSIPILDLQVLGENLVRDIDQNSSPSSPKNIITSSPNQTGANSILVVDDSINVRRYLALLLKKAGFKVEQAKDGEEAIAKLREGLLVNVVLSDVEMPRLDGYGLLSQIKSEPQLQYLPVVMLTSRSGDKHRDLAISLGAAEYFTKPFTEDELMQCLKKLAMTSIPNIL